MTCPRCEQLVTAREIQEFAYGAALRRLAGLLEPPDSDEYNRVWKLADEAWTDLDRASSELTAHMASH